MAIAIVAVVGFLAAGIAAVVGFGIGSLLTPAFALFLIVLGLYMAIAGRG